MVSIWFVVAMECLLLFACALSDPAFIRSMARDRTFPLWERVESTFSLIEALSFGFLFAVAAFCLEYYRFQEARIFFLLGCELFAVRMIAVTYKNLRGTWKWMFVPIICGVMIAVTIYLLGIVDGAQAEKREQTDKMDRSKWDYVHNLYQARTTKVEAPHQRDISIESLKLMDSSALAHQGLITAEQMRVMVADWADVTPNTATDTPQHIKQRQQALADRFHRSFRPLMVLARDESAEIARV